MTNPSLDRRSLLRGAVAGGISVAGLAAGTAGPAAAGNETVGTVTGPAIYFCANSGVRAVDIETLDGWYYDEQGSALDGSPLVVDGTCYFLYEGSGTGGAAYENSGVIALDASTGSELWHFDEPTGWSRGAPTVADDTLFFGSYDISPDEDTSTFRALDATTGEERWAWTGVEGIVDGSPTVADDTVFFPGIGGRSLYAFDVESGEQRWTFTEYSGSVETSPTVVDGTVYHAMYDGDDGEGAVVYAVDGTTGEREWQFNLSGGGVHASPAVTEEAVYIGTDDTLWAIDTEDGSELWRFTEPDAEVNTPTVADGTVYAGSWDETLYAVDAERGSLRWSFTEPEDRIMAAPTVYDGIVYAGSRQEGIYGVDVDTGEEQFSFQLDWPHHYTESSPTVVAEPADGHSVGSRVMLGTLGHHDHWTHAGQTLAADDGDEAEGDGTGTDDTSQDDDQLTDGTTDDGSPGFAIVGTLAALGGAGYLLDRRRGDGADD